VSMGRTRILAAIAAAAVAVLVCVAAPSAARAAGMQDLPVLTQPVNDLANVIDGASAASMDQIIRSLQASTGDAVIVATVKSFAPFATIEEYAVKLYERAGIGAKGKDNGVLILVAVDERRARIEVGYGLEGVLTDGTCGEIIRTAMLPAFRRGAYGEGLLAATTEVATRIAKERNVTLTNLPEPPQRERQISVGAGSIVKLIFFILIVLFVISRGGGGGGLLGFLLGQAIANSGRRSRGGWSGWNGGFGGGGFGGGGLGGGGFGGFGGGRSGGGGASGGW